MILNIIILIETPMAMNIVSTRSIKFRNTKNIFLFDGLRYFATLYALVYCCFLFFYGGIRENRKKCKQANFPD